jgi:site-specific DNA-cytosine methylase
VNTIELFSGTKSFSKVAKELGHETLTIDNEPSLNPDVCCDIRNYHEEIGKLNLYPKDILWASPPCTAFSIASCSHHWDSVKFSYVRYYMPKSESANLGLTLLNITLKFIANTKPKIWFIENPRGLMRKLMPQEMAKIDYFHKTNYKRVTVWYCRYGDTRAKPTDIWTNLMNWEGRTCHNNNKECHHEASPRGSKTGTQGLKNAKDRGVIPRDLFIEIFKAIEVHNA